MGFENYLFRASQVSLICTGNIGITEKQEERLKELQKEQETGINANGNKIKWTSNKNDELKSLLEEKENPIYPKTLISELKKIYRSEKYNRNFSFTNKFVQKGIVQENEVTTAYQKYLMGLGHKVFFTQNTERLFNDFITGEPDLMPIMFNGKKTGFDTKASWELETFPFSDEKLNSAYEYQNQSYMWLTDSEEWITAYGLVNIHEHGLNNEKMKYWHPLGCPSSYEDKYYDEYVEKCKELEIRLIFDYDRFKEHYPYHNLEISRNEWMETINPFTGLKGYDIPLKDRIVEKKSVRDDSKIEFIKERVEISRKILSELK